jgi:hypothetical protein
MASKQREAEEPEEVVLDPAAQKIHDWRLVELIRAFGEQKDPLEMEDVELLGMIARGVSDLHDVCRAFRCGCTFGQAVVIFT